ncbi:12971_t:CDS:2 [Gigaspora margarita]|uniref:12971_t:CDS:1 n=1 Tax=Gigaspora margarita TaxID=4874 RepID=A0ABN7UZX1_GIGMA|nr:12971_t:CDS:2 [Gigaspora margarita]
MNWFNRLCGLPVSAMYGITASLLAFLICLVKIRVVGIELVSIDSIVLD